MNLFHRLLVCNNIKGHVSSGGGAAESVGGQLTPMLEVRGQGYIFDHPIICDRR